MSSENETRLDISAHLQKAPYRLTIGSNGLLEIAAGARITRLSGRVRGENNRITIDSWCAVDDLEINIDGDNNTVTLGRNSSCVRCSFLIGGDRNYGNFRGSTNTVVLGEGSNIQNVCNEIRGCDNRVLIGEDAHILSLSQRSQLFVAGFDCMIEIGAETSIESAMLAVTEVSSSIAIGSDNMFAGMVVISTGDGHPIYDIETMRRVNRAGHVKTGDHVWLAGSARLMKNARVGDGCVVGADTFITADVIDNSTGRTAENAVISGTPPRIIRRGVTWSRAMFYDLDSIDQARAFPDAVAQSACHRGHLLANKANDLKENAQLGPSEQGFLTAISSYEEAISLKPDYAYAHCSLGAAQTDLADLLALQGRQDEAGQWLEKAVPALRAALEIIPDYDQARVRLAKGLSLNNCFDMPDCTP